MRRHSSSIDGFQTRRGEGLAWLGATDLAGVPWLVHGFSTRHAGDGNDGGRNFTLGAPDGADTPHVRANRRKFMTAIRVADFALAATRQIHSDRIFEVSARADGCLDYFPPACPPSNRAKEPYQGDALITRQAEILLSIRTADCVPILLADVRKRVVAAVHAGWRGLLSRIVEKTVGEMRRGFSSEPRDILAAVGPSIGVCCYQVGLEVVEAFSGAFSNTEDLIESSSLSGGGSRQSLAPGFLSPFPPGHALVSKGAFNLNLAAIARRQLQAAGIPRRSIAISSACTACQNDRFFSYRKEGSRAGRMMAVIGMRPVTSQDLRAPDTW